MADIPYQKLRFLIADDFSAFRSTVNRMLVEMGVENVDAASTGEEVVERCQQTKYDVVLSDYNLGAGRNGQQVLEELRYKQHLNPQSVFVLVSAEAARNIVMSSYEAAPDDYLMKPITAQMLQTRLKRLLTQRAVFSPVYAALLRNDTSRAIDVLIDMSIAENRYATAAQKQLGDLFLSTGEYKKAEKLFMRVLEVRELDWARLGLAKAKSAQGDLEQAGAWFEKIIEDNYLYLPAYDALSENWIKYGDTVAAQEVVKRSVEVSPMSILRQKNLANLARQNADYGVEVEALRKAVKLGRQSCYGTPADKLGLARSVSDALQHKLELSGSAISEASEALLELASAGELSLQETVQMKYISSRMNALRSKAELALEQLSEAETRLLPEDSNIDVEVDHIKALLALDFRNKVDELLDRLKQLYANDQDALEKLDPFFDEPVSAVNKAMVAEVNKKGIELYNDCQFDAALACFDDAIKLFPNHIGLQLNVVQALIGKLKTPEATEELHVLCRDSLEKINATIDESNSQFKRFLQLKNLAKNFYESA